jgi:hypothetical protein
MRVLLMTEAPARTLTLAPSAAPPPSHLSRSRALRVNLVLPACNLSLFSWPPSETWRRPRQILGERLDSFDQSINFIPILLRRERHARHDPSS